MTATTTRNLLDQVRQFHHQLADHCQRSSQLSGNERIRMLLDYVGRHETHLADTLQHWQDQAQRPVLDTWFRNAPAERLPALADCPLTPGSSVAEVVAWAVHMDEAIIEFYRTLAAEAEAPAVRKALEALLSMEEKEEHRMVRSALTIDDL